VSVAAAYGVVVAVFQFGWGKNVLNFTSNGSVARSCRSSCCDPVFGLSMDYHVFILSRIRGAYDRGMSAEDAVAMASRRGR
jgi:putative drug exporter of the RND superfamily